MNCAVHTDTPATGYCRNCGKALCPACARPVRDVLYCEDCLAAQLGHTAPAPAAQAVAGVPAPLPPTGSAPQRAGSPALAFILGFMIPGLGAVYNGEYNKALVHIVVFAAMIVGLSSGLSVGPTVALSFLLAGFVFYMAIDSMRTAEALRAGRETDDPLESWSKDRPIGPMLLIGIGALFLLGNFGLFDWYRIGQFWPVILIVLGVLMLRNRLGRPE